MITPLHPLRNRPDAHPDAPQTRPTATRRSSDGPARLPDAPRNVTEHISSHALAAPLLEAALDFTVLSISLHGELDLAPRAPVADAMDAILTYSASEPSSTVRLDLAELSFLDAGGLDLILGFRAAVTQRGGALQIQHPNPRIRRIFELCDLSGVLPDDIGHDDPGTDQGIVVTPEQLPAGIAHPIGETEPDPARNSKGELSATHLSAVDLSRVLDALRNLVVSAEPAVVFTSLAALCTAHMCAKCTVDLIEPDRACYRIQRPLASHPNSGGRAPTSGGDTRPPGTVGQAHQPAQPVATTVSVPFVGTSMPNQPDYRGRLMLHWDSGHLAGEADTVLARILAERGVTAVHDGRLEAQLAAARSKADGLQTALVNNRNIGCAIGILMARHSLTRQQAFDRLRTTSQDTHRKLRDVAADVLYTGDLIADRQRRDG